MLRDDENATSPPRRKLVLFTINPPPSFGIPGGGRARMDMLRTPGDQENIMARLRPASSPAASFPFAFRRVRSCARACYALKREVSRRTFCRRCSTLKAVTAGCGYRNLEWNVRLRNFLCSAGAGAFGWCGGIFRRDQLKKETRLTRLFEKTWGFCTWWRESRRVVRASQPLNQGRVDP